MRLEASTMEADAEGLIRLMKGALETTRGRAVTADEARELVRLASRAKWMRKQASAHDAAGKRLKALETAIARAFK
jgi:hypothetical protein